jgi:phosphoribosyl-ATP pyrophosphohydrolase/phosphoribosyl-AMP cyclohydrolase
MFTAAIGRRSARDLGRRTTNPARKAKTQAHPANQAGFFVFMDYSKLDGLVPAVIQDAESAEVLMVGFMNEQALAETRRTGYATFFSRSRNRLWTKGETSGNKLEVLEILVDCDDDTVLLKVKRLGDGNVCHTGQRTCFYRSLQEHQGH